MNKTFSGPVVLVILDGWGHREETRDNGVALAKKPCFDALMRDYPHTLIDGSGPAVGLPPGIMGNSEVGHMNLGAGRVVFSGLSQIFHAIEDGSFFANPALAAAMEQAKKPGATLHLMGLLSDGAVHSHEAHLHALLEMAKRRGVPSVAVHCFLDGRDTAPFDAPIYLERLAAQMAALGVGRIASVSGRFFAMDRDQRWERVEKACRAIRGAAPNRVRDALAHVRESHARGTGDEFVEPATIEKADGSVTGVGADDAFIFFNFRADRAREITRAFVDKSFTHFDRGTAPLPRVFTCMAPYEESLALPVAFAPAYPDETLPEILSRAGVRQLRIAETEKYAHVTFFFNGGKDVVFEGEDRALVPSPKEVPTYDKKPEMSAFGVRDELVARLKTKKYGFVACNFANADMVGHTAVPEAVVQAVEAVDSCLKDIVDEILSQNGVAIVTADHGNAEEMKDARGRPMTAHTTNLVPFILVGRDFMGRAGEGLLRAGGRLCDVAPTVLALMKLPRPRAMTGVSLLK